MKSSFYCLAFPTFVLVFVILLCEKVNTVYLNLKKSEMHVKQGSLICWSWKPNQQTRSKS